MDSKSKFIVSGYDLEGYELEDLLAWIMHLTQIAAA